MRFSAETHFSGPLKDSQDLQVKEEETCLYVSPSDNQRRLHALYKSQLGTLLSSMENRYVLFKSVKTVGAEHLTGSNSLHLGAALA